MAKGASSNRTEKLVRPDAIIVFVDIRGFSQWSEKIDSHDQTLPLVSKFKLILEEHFPKVFRKPLGDGAMLVQEVSLRTQDVIDEALTSILQRAALVEAAFNELTTEISISSGNPTEMVLGWGITRGRIIKQGTGQTTNYLGHHINKAARLCELARPRGIVIDRDDFRNAPDGYRTDFFLQIKRLQKPLEEVKVWVSAEINATFQIRERLRETPEVHIAGMCLRERGNGLELLLAQRSAERRLYPDKWEGCGEQLRYSESFHDGVRRHFLTEMHIEVEVVTSVAPEIYKIEISDMPIIPGLRFLCRYIDGEAYSPNHQQVQWVDVKTFAAMSEDDFPPDLKMQTLALIDRYSATPITKVA